MKYVVFSFALFLALVALATAVPISGRAPSPSPSPPALPPASPPGSPTATSSPGTARYPVIDPSTDPRIWCRSGNPACHREPWWAEYDEAPLNGRCHYAFLPRAFSTDCSLAEAVVLLWQWGEGKRLLSDAAAWGVTVTVVPQATLPGQGTAALYQPIGRMVRMGEPVTHVSTWMLAAILAHELTHARQDQQRFAGGCVAIEQPAYQMEVDFANWIADRMGGWPSRQAVAQHISDTDMVLFDHLTSLRTISGLIGHVGQACANQVELW